MNTKSFIILSLITANFLFAQHSQKLQEITVTANKVEENINEVSQSISVFDEERLDELGIKKIDELFKEVPNFHASGEVGEGIQNYRDINTAINTSGALVDDRLYLGINGAYSKSDGWVDLDENSNKYDNKNFNAF